tara:strand:+ start:3507 stop:3635 length:129 start_codon:yes stop_codon:yes gene_type:complete
MVSKNKKSWVMQKHIPEFDDTTFKIAKKNLQRIINTLENQTK